MKVLFRSFELDTANIVIGNYVEENGFHMVEGIPNFEKPCVRDYIIDGDGNKREVTPDYLSINFPDMLDSEGNKIFASLSEDGKGATICQLFDCDGGTFRDILIWKDNRFLFKHSGDEYCDTPTSNILAKEIILCGS